MNPTEDTPKPPINLTLDNGKPEQLLTGQEWFDRFVALFKWPEQDPSEPVEAYVYKAARAAAGLDTPTQSELSNLNERKATMKTTEVTLDEGQLQSILRLINDEMELNQANGDGTYNGYWDRVKKALGYVE